MQMLYDGYDVVADLAPRTAYDEVVKALGGGGETVTDPSAIGPAIDRAFASGRSLPGQRDHRRQRGLPARDVRELMEIRLVEPSEYGAVSDLIVAAYVADGFIAPSSGYVRQLRDTATRAEQAEIWVAVDGEELLGVITNCPAGSPWKELAGDGEGEFRMLAVAPAARGRGIGEALVRHCVALSKAAGDRGMVLSTMDLMTGAHRIYERVGFHRVPDEDWSPDDGVCLMAFRMTY